MAAGDYTLRIEAGATITEIFTWQDGNGDPVDLTDYTARLMARRKISDASPFLTLNSEDGGITLGGTAGTITLNISAADSSAIAVDRGVYDLELVSSGGVVTRLLEGSVIVSPEVTR